MKATRLALGSFLFVALFASASMAQLQRSFVSGTGNDGNPCTRPAPCRTFTQALSQTNPHGEVVALDSAGYGPFTITQSVTVQAAPGVYAGISVFSGDGITINAGVNDGVVLRGLTVTNQGSSGNGVVFNTGVVLHVEGCEIVGFSSAGSAGLELLAAGARAEVIDSTMGGNTFGILMQPASGIEQAAIDHVRLVLNHIGLAAKDGSQVSITNSVAANNDFGLRAPTGSGSVQLNVESTAVSGSSMAGIVAIAVATGPVQVNIARCVISNNVVGIQSTSTSTGVATVRLAGSTVTGNGTGLQNVGAPALLLSRGDNTVEGNTTDTLGTIGSYTAK